MSWLCSWVVTCQFPHLTFVTKLNPFAVGGRLFSSMVSVCDPLNLFMVGGRSFSSMVTVCDHQLKLLWNR